jgi:4-diphosphocytidyl-2-C-methyl-D-erythritol kinase
MRTVVSADATGRLHELAPAKVNLTLRILGRRADGYHELESLVAFASLADRLTLRPDTPLSLSVDGPTAGQAGALADNLVLKAARAAVQRIPGLRLGAFELTKRIPAGGGLGGGSSDAAAALRLLAQANDLAIDDPRFAAAALATGADIPVCLDPRPRVMRGVGEQLSEALALPALSGVLVGPGFPLATREVFSALGLAAGERRGGPADDAIPGEREALLAYLADRANDLEPAALRLAPAIGDILGALRKLAGCRLARMSGSGTTCFGLYDTPEEAAAAAARLADARPDWWVAQTELGPT